MSRMCPAGPGEDHPHLLLWYVSGTLEPSERRDIERHLESCAPCRREARSLASMMKSVQTQSRTDHVDAADLVLYEEAADLGADRRAPIESHLDECAGCREDLAILRRARLSARRPQAASGPLRVARWTGAALAAAALLAIASIAVPPGQPVVVPVPAEATSAEPLAVDFPAPVRGLQAARRLEGRGPWAIRVALPYDAAEGPYRITIQRGRSVVGGLDIVARADRDKCLTVILPGLPGPGPYEMSLRRDDPAAAESYSYPFDLVPGTGPSPAL